MFLMIFIILHWIANLVGFIYFASELDSWHSDTWAKKLFRNAKSNNLINSYCKYGIKVKHIFIFWVFIYDFTLLILITKCMKLGEITLIKKK